MTFWILLVLAGWLSYLSFRNKNMLLALGASIMWLCLMAYNLSYPPTNITQGDTIHEWMTMGFVVLAIAVLYTWFRNRGKTESQTKISVGDNELLLRSAKSEGVTKEKSLMDKSPEEYRAYVRRAIRRGKRR